MQIKRIIFDNLRVDSESLAFVLALHWIDRGMGSIPS